jgi:hypothetical protein
MKEYDLRLARCGTEGAPTHWLRSVCAIQGSVELDWQTGIMLTLLSPPPLQAHLHFAAVREPADWRAMC